jgi:argininosuccinate lyase
MSPIFMDVSLLGRKLYSRDNKVKEAGAPRARTGMRQRLREPLGRPFVDAILRPRLLADATAALPAMLAANRAHLVMLRARDLIPADAARLVARALAEIERAGLPPETLDPGLEDLYANLERAVARAAGEDAAGRMHVARSRNDLWATVARMNAREALLATRAAVHALRERLLALADEHAGLVMPGFTHLQPAQPVTAGFWLLGVAEAVARDAGRLADAWPRVNVCPLGAAAFAGTSFPVDRALTARLLGFDAPMASALDAVASRDFVLELLGGFAVLALTLSRLAEDLYVWSSAPVGLVDFSGAVAVASSIMPQKKNAAALEHVKGRAGQVVGALTAAMVAVKGTHFMHSRDTSVEVAQTLAQGEQALAVVLSLTAAALDAITFRPDACRRAAGEHFTTVTDLADALVREAGLPFRVAHEICADLVREAVERGRGVDALDAATVSAAATARAGREVRLAEATLRALLDPAASAAARRVTGGSAPAAVREGVAAARAALAEDRARDAARRAALDAAREALARESDRLAGLDRPLDRP